MPRARESEPFFSTQVMNLEGKAQKRHGRTTSREGRAD